MVMKSERLQSIVSVQEGTQDTTNLLGRDVAEQEHLTPEAAWLLRGPSSSCAVTNPFRLIESFFRTRRSGSFPYRSEILGFGCQVSDFEMQQHRRGNNPKKAGRCGGLNKAAKGTIRRVHMGAGENNKEFTRIGFPIKISYDSL